MKTKKFEKSFILKTLVIFTLLTILFIIIAFKNINTNNANAIDIGYKVKDEPYILYETSLSECIENADIIIKCKVINVGETYLADGYTLNIDDSFEEVKKNIIGIRTPVTIEISEFLKGASMLKDNIITIDEYYGSYNGHELIEADMKINLVENNEYILFIKELDDKYYILNQPSVLLLDTNSITANHEKLSPEKKLNIQKGFVSLLSNELLFENTASLKELTNSMLYKDDIETYEDVESFDK